tara:strand:+ start:655 stop:813 length:159 start_codon:yes stop_codon:yes gene_type:complete
MTSQELEQIKSEAEKYKVLYLKFQGAAEILESMLREKEENSKKEEKPVVKKK